MRHLCDSNVGIASVLMSHPHHRRARSWIENLSEPDELEKIGWKLANLPEASPKIWMDSYLASFAIAANLRFVTFDKGFERYKKNSLDLLLLESLTLEFLRITI